MQTNKFTNVLLIAIIIILLIIAAILFSKNNENSMPRAIPVTEMDSEKNFQKLTEPSSQSIPQSKSVVPSKPSSKPLSNSLTPSFLQNLVDGGVDQIYKYTKNGQVYYYATDWEVVKADGQS